MATATARVDQSDPWILFSATLFYVVGFIDAFLIFPTYPIWALFEMIVLGAVIYGLSARWPEAAYR